MELNNHQLNVDLLLQTCIIVMTDKRKENEGKEKLVDDNSGDEDDGDEERPSVPPRKVIEQTE